MTRFVIALYCIFTEESPGAESLLWMIQSRSLSLTLTLSLSRSRWDTRGSLRAGRGSRCHLSARAHSGPRNLCRRLRERRDQHPCRCRSLCHQDNINIHIRWGRLHFNTDLFRRRRSSRRSPEPPRGRVSGRRSCPRRCPRHPRCRMCSQRG